MKLYSIKYRRNVRLKGNTLTKGKHAVRDRDVVFEEFVTAESFQLVLDYWRHRIDDLETQTLSIICHDDVNVLATLK